jgi:hypothetical protein
MSCCLKVLTCVADRMKNRMGVSVLNTILKWHYDESLHQVSTVSLRHSVVFQIIDAFLSL